MTGKSMPTRVRIGRLTLVRREVFRHCSDGGHAQRSVGFSELWALPGGGVCETSYLYRIALREGSAVEFTRPQGEDGV